MMVRHKFSFQVHFMVKGEIEGCLTFSNTARKPSGALLGMRLLGVSWRPGSRGAVLPSCFRETWIYLTVLCFILSTFFLLFPGIACQFYFNSTQLCLKSHSQHGYQISIPPNLSHHCYSRGLIRRMGAIREESHGWLLRKGIMCR